MDRDWQGRTVHMGTGARYPQALNGVTEAPQLGCLLIHLHFIFFPLMEIKQ